MPIKCGLGVKATHFVLIARLAGSWSRKWGGGAREVCSRLVVLYLWAHCPQKDRKEERGEDHNSGHLRSYPPTTLSNIYSNETRPRSTSPPPPHLPPLPIHPLPPSQTHNKTPPTLPSIPLLEKIHIPLPHPPPHSQPDIITQPARPTHPHAHRAHLLSPLGLD